MATLIALTQNLSYVLSEKIGQLEKYLPLPGPHKYDSFHPPPLFSDVDQNIPDLVGGGRILKVFFPYLRRLLPSFHKKLIIICFELSQVAMKSCSSPYSH